MLPFHRLVLPLDTQVSFGHTTVSHDGAAGFLNTLVLTAVLHDGAKGCFVCCRLIRWCCRFFEYVGSRCSFTRWCCTMFRMSPFQTLVLLPGTLVSFGHTTGSHDGASGSLNTLVLIAVLKRTSAAGYFVCCSSTGWCCF